MPCFIDEEVERALVNDDDDDDDDDNNNNALRTLSSFECNICSWAVFSDMFVSLVYFYVCTKAVWKVRGLAALSRCYAVGGGDCYAKL
jgi:hypothetical protein